MTKPIQSETGVMLVREDTGETRVIGLRNHIVGPWRDAFYVRVVGDWMELPDEEKMRIFSRLHGIHVPTSFSPFYTEGSQQARQYAERDRVLQKYGLEGE